MRQSRVKLSASGLLTSVSLMAALITPALARAQTSVTAPAKSEPSDSQLGDIVVTAQRRETNLQTTSASVSALSSETIESARLRSVEDVSQLVPNVTFAKSNNEQQISIRGVGVDNAFFTAEAGVAVYLDGVYLGRPNIATAALSNLERIEVVRGPQGTLYGRNATGGAVNIITQGASEQLMGKVYGSYGNYEAYDIGGSIAGPLGDGVSARVSADYASHDGYVRNLASGRRLDGGRDLSLSAALRLEASDRLTFDLRGDYQHIDSTGPALQPFNVTSTAGPNEIQFTFGPGTGRYVNAPRRVYHDLNDAWTRIYYGTNLTATYDFGSAALKSITAYRHSYTNQDADLDGTDGVFDTLHNRKTPTGALQAHQFSEELQLVSDGSGPISYIAGLYYYNERARVRVVTDQSDYAGGTFRTDYAVVQKTRSTAAYGELYYNPTESLRFTAGLRYTSDHKSFSSSIGTLVSGSKTDTSFTPKFGAEYKFDENVFGYATISRGFKAGGFNPYTNSGFYKPESLWNYEAGLKTRLFDKRLQANIAGFYYDYKDIQVTQYTFLGPDISNVGNAKIKGLELELLALPTRGLRLGGSVSYLDAQYGAFSITDLLTGVPTNVDGNQVTKSPKWSLTGNLEYSFEIGSAGTLALRYDISYKSSFFFSAFNTPGTRQGNYAVSNAQITYSPPGNSLKISAYVKNLTNKAVFVQAVQASALLFPSVGYNPPRTYGISVIKSF